MPKKPSNAASKRIFLVEDHAILREGLSLFIGQEPGMEVCGEAGSAAAALSAIQDLRPDVVVTDISMPGMNGVEFIKNLKALHPEIAVVVLSMHDESIYAERALRAGALGYVMKKESTKEVIIALRKAFLGERHVSKKVAGSLTRKMLGTQGSVPAPSSVEDLSDRELEVYEHIGRGGDTKAIAGELGVSPKTIDTHRMHIKEKLRISSMTELVQHAAVWVEQNTSCE